MIRATKTLRADPNFIKLSRSITEETATAAIGLKCGENDRSQASLDQTDFPKRLWKIRNMTPLEAAQRILNNDAEWSTVFCLDNKKPQIP